MASINTLRNQLIDKILSIQNADFLKALDVLVDSKTDPNQKVKLSKSQIEMLKLSEADIKAGRLIDQDLMDKADLEWLSER
ncbi:MAG: hypothetical protein WD048_16800 [Chitinophagales bacterium]